MARTLVDLADVLRPDQLEQAFEQAERLRVLDLRAIERCCRRNRGRRGLRPLAEVLRSYRPEATDVRSKLERRFLKLCRAAELPLPQVNVIVEGYEVDAVWHRERLVVELDSRAFHDTRAAFERDRARDMALQLAGYRVIRLTHKRLVEDPAGVVAALRGLLAAAPVPRLSA